MNRSRRRNGKTSLRRWGYRIRVSGADASRTPALHELRPETVRDTRPGERVKVSRSSTTYAFATTGGREVFYKIDHCRGPLDWFKSLFRPSRALRAWRALGRLSLLGFPVPPRVLCGERRRGPFLLGSFVVTERIPGCVSLDRYCRQFPGPGGETDPRQREVLAGLAGLVRRLHDLDIDHADLNPANVLIRENPCPEFFLLDADRTRFPPRLTRRRKIRNLAQLNAFLERRVSLRNRLRFLHFYNADPGRAGRRQHRKLLEQIDRMTRRRWRRSAEQFHRDRDSREDDGRHPR